MAFTDGWRGSCTRNPQNSIANWGESRRSFGKQISIFSKIISAQITSLIMPVLWAEWEYMCACVCSISTHYSELAKKKIQGSPVDLFVFSGDVPKCGIFSCLFSSLHKKLCLCFVGAPTGSTLSALQDLETADRKGRNTFRSWSEGIWLLWTIYMEISEWQKENCFLFESEKKNVNNKQMPEVLGLSNDLSNQLLPALMMPLSQKGTAHQ